MPQRETASSMAIEFSIAPQNTTGDINGDAVDVTEGDAAAINIKFGANVDADSTFKIQEDDGAGGWTDLTPVQEPAIDGVLYGKAYPAAPISANSLYRYAYVGKRETVRVVLENTDASTDIVSFVVIEKLFERANLVDFLD